MVWSTLAWGALTSSLFGLESGCSSRLGWRFKGQKMSFKCQPPPRILQTHKIDTMIAEMEKGVIRALETVPPSHVAQSKVRQHLGLIIETLTF
jgi:hypothetical protein